MHPAAYTIVDGMLGDEKLVFDARRVAVAVGGVMSLLALPFAGGVLFNQSQISQMETVSASLDLVIEGRVLVQAAHAGGVAKGLLIGGVHVPETLIDRIEAIVTEEVVTGARRLAEARIGGLEAGLDGRWSLDRLEEYVSRIETGDPALSRIISEQTERLVETGVPEDLSRAQMRAIAVGLMTGGEDQARTRKEQTWGRAANGSDPDRAAILEQARTRIWSHLEEQNLLDGLDPTITRNMAVTLVSRMLETAPEQGDEPTGSPNL
jgi:hypothetical protein